MTNIHWIKIQILPRKNSLLLRKLKEEKIQQLFKEIKKIKEISIIMNL
jgi:hypothetical protein